MMSQVNAYLKQAQLSNKNDRITPREYVAPRKGSDDRADRTPREHRSDRSLLQGKRIAKRQNEMEKASREEGEVVSDKTNSRRGHH